MTLVIYLKYAKDLKDLVIVVTIQNAYRIHCVEAFILPGWEIVKVCTKKKPAGFCNKL
jgi:hypothetical protein